MFNVSYKDTRTTPTLCSSVSIVNFEHVITSWLATVIKNVFSRNKLKSTCEENQF